MTDVRVKRLLAAFRAGTNAEHAAFHKEYHKSELRFHGIRTPAYRAMLKQAFPTRPKLAADDARNVVKQLWDTDFHEERVAAIELLMRAAKELEPSDLPWLYRLTHEINGWGLLDGLGVHVLGPMALEHGDAVYKVVRKWSTDKHMWTRRASVLVHAFPARRGKLDHGWSWPTFEELLPEKEFFIRKAVGWALRECCAHYPTEVHDFLQRVGDRASGLTRREGARKLPAALRKPILGK